MSIDGTWGGEAQLINISKTKAELAVGQTADLAEFFLLLTSFGQWCTVAAGASGVQGARIGVTLNHSEAGTKPAADALKSLLHDDR